MNALMHHALYAWLLLLSGPAFAQQQPQPLTPEQQKQIVQSFEQAAQRMKEIKQYWEAERLRREQSRHQIYLIESYGSCMSHCSTMKMICGMNVSATDFYRQGFCDDQERECRNSCGKDPR
jgi:hypothetical protein